MPDVALLELARSVVLLHEQREPGESVLVLPAVHDAIETDHLALEAIVSRYGGRYIRCDDDGAELHQARGPIHQVMAKHISELSEQRNLAITFHENDGRVTVAAEGYAEPTGSLPTVLRVLATLASSELEAPFVVLSYPLDGLDDERAALLWEATLAPALFAPPELGTFVPVAASRVDVSAHCNREEGAVRIVIREGELIERGPRRLLADSLRQIVDVVDRPLVLFLGAGASATAGIPQGNRVRDTALASLTDRSIGSDELIPAFRQWLTDHDRWMSDERDLPLEVFVRNLTLERVLREEFHQLGGRPRSDSATVKSMERSCGAALDRMPDGRQALWKLASELPNLVVATVNFDQLIEIGMDADHLVVVGEEQFEEHRDLVTARLRGEALPLPILKIHGSIDQVDTLVADLNKTSRGLPTEISATLDAMLAAAPYLTWVWIGCSMRDADIGQWLKSKDGGPGKDLQEWWVDPLPPNSVRVYAQERRIKEWAQMDLSLRDRVITETSDRFLSKLLAHVERLKP